MERIIATRILPKKIVKSISSGGHVCKTTFETVLFGDEHIATLHITQFFLRPKGSALYAGEILAKTFKEKDLVFKVIAMKAETLNQYFSHVIKYTKTE